MNVCSLVTPAEANEVARGRGLDGSQTASTTHQLKTTVTDDLGSVSGPSYGCKFFISDTLADGTPAAQATVEMRIGSA